MFFGRLINFSILLSALVLLIGAGPAFAQEENGTTQANTVTVGVYESPPFVERDDLTYAGMAIDLWEAIAHELGLAYRYEPYSTFRDLVDATANGEIDAAVTNLTITRNRAERITFTQPWYDAGLRIMVPNEGSSGFWRVITGLEDAGHLRAYLWLLAVIVLGTIGFTIFDRKFDPEFPKRWREGIAESFYHVMSIATSGRAARKNLFGWIGRIWQGLWLVVGVGVIAYITSSVTSVMTAVSITHGISSLADLPGRTVGVFTGSVAEEYVRELGIATRSYPGMEEAAAALDAGRIEAIVGDAPILEHYAYAHSGESLSVVGNIFHPDKYGFAFPHDSALIIPVTLEILELQESGALESLRLRYFGNEL